MCEFPLELANPESPANYREQEPFRGRLRNGRGEQVEEVGDPRPCPPWDGVKQRPLVTASALASGLTVPETTFQVPF